MTDGSPSGTRAAGFNTPSEVWRSDGTAAGTIRVASGFAETWTQTNRTPAVELSRGEVLFAADDGLRGRELWKVDPGGATAQNLGFGCGATLASPDPVLGSAVEVTGTAPPGPWGHCCSRPSLRRRRWAAGRVCSW
ncbi:MAG: hypothetical protein AAF628_25480 [Planctomycetota bacterium]